jgi:hypothetical protein
MLEKQIDQAERLAVMRNEQRVREEQGRVFAPNQSEPNQASTYHQHAQADADIPRGRYTAHQRSSVTGATPNPASLYPPGPAWCADPGAQCLEPPLGFDNPALDASSTVLLSSSGEATGPTLADAPSTPLGQRADVGSFSSDDPATEGLAPPSASPLAQRGGVGSSPAFRRRV